MIDVHPPEHTPHTWRDFFIHMFTIVLGLVIAIGLEQSVEAIHRHREAAELRADLRAETGQVLADAHDTDVAISANLTWLHHRIQQLQATVWHHKPLAPALPKRELRFASPDIPLWRAAKSSGRTVLLTKGEVNAYAEVEYVQTHLDLHAETVGTADSNVRSFEKCLPSLPDGHPDFSVMTPADQRTYLDLLTQEATAVQAYQTWVRILLGAELAVRAGKTKLPDIYASEVKSSQINNVW